MAADQTETILSRVRAWLTGDQKAQIESVIPPQDDDTLAQALETDINEYLTTIASGSRTRSGCCSGFTCFGCEFKKVYNCRCGCAQCRSQRVPANELIVNNGATDLKNATRVTHRIRMPHSTMVRMQISGAYRKQTIAQTPSEQPDSVEKQISVESLAALFPELPEQECIGTPSWSAIANSTSPARSTSTQTPKKPTGLPLPYKVSIR